MKYRVYGVVTGGKYLGEFEADSKEAAEELALMSSAGHISLCHECAQEFEDAEITEVSSEKV